VSDPKLLCTTRVGCMEDVEAKCFPYVDPFCLFVCLFFVGGMGGVDEMCGPYSYE
jgi:hypothetical protein